MKKVVVTGANGFIGSALCRELADRGIEVIAIVKNAETDTSNLSGLPKLRIITCDLSEFDKLAALIPDRDIDVLYHLAWIGVSGSQRGDCSIQLSNIKYTCDTVKSCAAMNCRRFVFASSIMEYEIQALMNTDCTPGINTLYSSSKVSADYMARTLSGYYGIDYIKALISNTYGPGEMSPRLINTSIRKLLSDEHCAFSDGTQMYDFIYITDTVKAFAAIGEKGIANRTYYIGSLNPKPLREFLYEMRDQIDERIELGIGELPPVHFSLTYREFDINAVRNDTGFIPEITFADGIRKTVDWIRGGGNSNRRL